MTKEEWNSLSPQQRKDAILKIDGSMRDPRWAHLLEQMVRPYEELTLLQRSVIDEDL